MSLQVLRQEIIDCQKCPRLLTHCQEIARTKRRAFRDQEYWGKPLPPWGAADARVLVLGLAPAAHGGNRTGRTFTGDSSGQFLFRALYNNGFAAHPTSHHSQDGQALFGVYIANAVRCAPPDNQPAAEEVAACRVYLERELAELSHLRVIVPLGKLAFDVYLSLLRDRGLIRSRVGFPFGHHALHYPVTGGPAVLCSYHPSQQNTSTRKLTQEMLTAVFATVRRLADGPPSERT